MEEVHRQSADIVSALWDYLSLHPELSCTIRSPANPKCSLTMCGKPVPIGPKKPGHVHATLSITDSEDRHLTDGDEIYNAVATLVKNMVDNDEVTSRTLTIAFTSDTDRAVVPEWLVPFKTESAAPHKFTALVNLSDVIIAS